MLSPRRLAPALAAIALLVAGTAWARTVWVNTRYAKVRAGTASTAAALGRVDYGQALTVEGEAPGFLKITLPDGKPGWIARQWTSDKAPSREGLSERLGEAARAGGGTGQVTYTAGARGLTDEAKTYAVQKDLATAAAAVERMEQLRVTDDDLETFLLDGWLGDWRGARGDQPLPTAATPTAGGPR